MKSRSTLFAILLLQQALCFSESVSKHLSTLWNQGHNEIYLSGYAWHNRYTYTAEKIKTYNEQAWGGGLGKGYFNEKGNWEGLYAFAFQDSHKNVQPVAGYAYQFVFRPSAIHLGAGISAFLTARPDIFNGIPFPGALPWFSAQYQRATLSALYIPGAQGAGNVLYLIGKWTL